MKIDTSGWGCFSIGNLFNVIKGTRLTKASMTPGTIRFIGSSAVNNGQTAYIGNNSHLHPSNTITVCYNGSIGETFYQDEEFWASDDVNVLYPKFDMNKEIALFIIPLIKLAGKKYSYTDKWTQDKMISDKISLPTKKDNSPDFEYMEIYMSKILNETQTSLTYLNSFLSK